MLKKPGDISNPDVPFVGAGADPGPKPSKKQAGQAGELPLAELRLHEGPPARVRARPSRSAGPWRTKWKHKASALTEFPPAIAQNRILQLSDDARLVSRDLETRQEALEAQARLACRPRRPAIEDGRVYVTLLETSKGSGSGRIVCLRFKGRQDPVVARRSPAAASPRRWSHNGRVYFGSEGGTVYALDAKSGKQDWTYRAGGAVKGSPTLSDDGVLFFGAYGGSVHAVRARDGARIWSKRAAGGLLRGGNFYATAAVAYGRVYIGATDGRAYSFSAKDGRDRLGAPDRPLRLLLGGGQERRRARADGVLRLLRRHLLRARRQVGQGALDAPLGRQDLRLADDRRRHRLLRRPRPGDHASASTSPAASSRFRYDIGAYDPIISDGENLYLTGNRSLTALEPRRLYVKRQQGQAGEGAQEEGRGPLARLPRVARELPPAGAVRAAGGGARAADPDARLMAVTRPELGPTLPGAAAASGFGIPPVVTLGRRGACSRRAPWRRS